MPATTPWYAGAPVPLAYSNTDADGNPADAVTVTATVVAPDGTMSTPSVVHSGLGQYSAVYTTSQAGHHLIAWTATGGVPGAYTDTFEVQSAMDGTIVSLAEAKEILQLSGTEQFDFKLQGYNAAVTNWIEWYCGPVVTRTVAEKLPAGGLTVQLSQAPVIELVAWTTIPAQLAQQLIPVPNPPSPMFPTRVFGVSYPVSQLYADPVMGTVEHTSGLPFYYGSYIWQYTAGRPVIPACIYEASKVVLKHLYMVELGGTGGGGTGAGDEETAMTPFGFAVPNRAIEMLAPEAIPAAIA
jgi:hypothetical protein